MAVLRTFLFSLLLCLCSATAFGQVSSAERAALIDFYHATGGDGWHDNTNWLADEGTECQWYGVECASPGGEHFVLRLMLTDNNLTGEMPNSLAGLDGLQTLFLGDNQLHGTIPEPLWDLPELAHLSLASNRFEGAVPAAVLGLHSGTRGAQLDLSGNLLDSFSLAGLPVAPADPPFRARLADNLFSELPPVEWRETGNLRELDLSRNRIEGTVAPGDTYWPGLEILTLSGNAITELAELLPEALPDLRLLALAGNRLESLPASLPDLPSLSMLNVGNNRLDGELPEWFAQLNLTRLDLDNNRLSGPIEGVFEALELDNFPLGRFGLVLHVANNRFSGPLPDIDFDAFNNPAQGQSPEFGLDLCFNDIDFPDAEALDLIEQVHRGRSLAPCLGREEADIDLSASGSWFGLERSGEGITQMVLENGQLLSYWFTYRPGHPRGQMWLFDVSEPGQSWSESRPLWRSSGGRFGEGLMGGEVVRSAVWMRQNRIDQDTVHFFYDYLGPSTCITGFCFFDIQTGRHDQIRLTELAGTTCDNQSRQTQEFSGAWYNPERAGEGFIVEILSGGRAVVYWFTHKPDGSGEQAWMIGVGEARWVMPLPPGVTNVSLTFDEVVQPVGGQFGPAFDPADVEMAEWGELSMHFTMPDSGEIQWSSLLDDYGSGTFPIERLARPMLAECEPEE